MDPIEVEFDRVVRDRSVEEVVECEARVKVDLMTREDIAKAFRVPPEVLTGAFIDPWFGSAPLRGTFRFR